MYLVTVHHFPTEIKIKYIYAFNKDLVMSKKHIKQGGLKSTNENNEMKIIVALVRTLQLH